MAKLYNDSTEDIAKSWVRIHGNSEQTHVFILSTGESSYTVVATDVDPRDYQPVAAEIIGYEPTLEGSHELAQRWMETHPKGIAGQQDSSGGLLQKLMGVFSKINEYGNEQVSNQQEANK